MTRRVRACLITVALFAHGCSPAAIAPPPVVPLSQAASLTSQPIPKTLDEALDALGRGGSGLFHAGMRSDDENTAVGVAGGMGGWADHWGLGYGSPLDTHLSSLGIHRPWEQRDAILRAYWRRLHHRPLDIEALAKASSERLAKEKE